MSDGNEHVPSYTPTTEDVREEYARWALVDDPAEVLARFDRWLAGHDREVERRTLLDAADAAAADPLAVDDPPVEWLCARAVSANTKNQTPQPNQPETREKE